MFDNNENVQDVKFTDAENNTAPAEPSAPIEPTAPAEPVVQQAVQANESAENIPQPAFQYTENYNQPSQTSFQYTNPDPQPINNTVQNSEPVITKDHKNKNAGKIVAGILAVALIGGTSGFGGAYLSNSIYGKNNATAASNDITTVKENTSAETTAPALSPVTDTSSESLPIESLLNTDTVVEAPLSTKDVITKVTPSVVAISSQFTDGTGTGTGIIMTEDGYIFTNAHVVETEAYVMDENSNDSLFGRFFGNSYTTTVEKAKKITVTMSDGDETEYEAEIIGTDAATDLAIIKIKAKGLSPAEIGTSDGLVMGQRSITLGYPLGMGLSASEGIISGLNKEMTIELPGGGTADMMLIQTDAAINPGNSGGPLLNEYGQVIGITSSKIVSSSIEGIGFAIPITDAMPLLQELLENGSITKTTPKIGIVGTDITTASQRYYNLPVDSGVLVISVEADSSAAAAGIGEGDVIVAADGKDIKNMDELINLKNKHKAGETMIITLARADGNVDVEITLGS